MRWNRKPGDNLAQVVAEPISRPVFSYQPNSARLSRASQPRRKSAKMPSPTRSSHRDASPSAPSSSRYHRSRHSHSHRHRPRESSRSRSRSDRHRSHRHHRRSEDRERGHNERRHRDAPAKPVVLPYQARELSGRDLKVYEPMFGMYLDIQKGKYIEDLSEDEVRGRWKSFTQKW